MPAKVLELAMALGDSTTLTTLWIREEFDAQARSTRRISDAT